MIVLKRPVVSEKSMKLAASNLYTFEVDKKASKPLIAKAVSEKFNVKVIAVRTVNIKGQLKQQRKVRKLYKSAPLKKAMVQLGKGVRIALFETPKEEVVVTTAEGEPVKLREKKDILGRTKVKVEKSSVGAAPTTQRKVITGK